MRKFIEEDVLDQATEVFWRRGFGATSVDDLTRATGLGRGSLYGAFGDKETLFLACLNHYTSKAQAPVLGALQHSDPRQAITGMFEAMVQRYSDTRLPPGCMQVNTALECPTAGEAITRQSAAAMARLQSTLYEVLRRAQTLGQLRPGQDPLALAQFLATVVQGLAVVSKTSADPAALKHAVEVALRIFEPA